VTDSPNTATLMFIAHRAAETRVHEMLRGTGFADLTSAQVRIAQRLSPNGIRITDLADQARVTKQTAGALVDELERNGYVTREPDPADARARLVMLSAKGRRLCAAAAAEVIAVEREWRDHLGANAYDEMRTALLALREVTDPYQ
jgi:DNA-binding MarR family transcriptional regulator